MEMVDWILIVMILGGLFLWVRGCRKASLADCLLAAGVAVIGCAAYFYFFSLTRVEYLGAMAFGLYAITLLPFVSLLKKPLGKALLAGSVVLALAAGVAEHRVVSAGNALLTIEPYRTGPNGWAFDAPALRLKREPFVLGAPEIINRLVKDFPVSDERVRMVFSQRPFPGAQLTLDLGRGQDGGHWYYCEEYKTEGWLCPALFKYFPRAPRHIYVMAEPL
jgi:hypothetical protein